MQKWIFSAKDAEVDIFLKMQKYIFFERCKSGYFTKDAKVHTLPKIQKWMTCQRCRTEYFANMQKWKFCKIFIRKEVIMPYVH